MTQVVKRSAAIYFLLTTFSSSLSLFSADHPHGIRIRKAGCLPKIRRLRRSDLCFDRELPTRLRLPLRSTQPSITLHRSQHRRGKRTFHQTRSSKLLHHIARVNSRMCPADGTGVPPKAADITRPRKVEVDAGRNLSDTFSVPSSTTNNRIRKFTDCLTSPHAPVACRAR